MRSLLDAPDVGLRRGDAIVAYAEALKEIAAGAPGADSGALLTDALAAVDAADPAGVDPGLSEIRGLIVALEGLLR